MTSLLTNGYSAVTLLVELLEAFVCLLSLVLSYQLMKKYPHYASKGYLLMLSGLILLFLHFIIDAIDTILYDNETLPKSYYIILDNSEALLAVFGSLFLTIGLYIVTRQLMNLWSGDPNST